jgi:hypothetical protein
MASAVRFTQDQSPVPTRRRPLDTNAAGSGSDESDSDSDASETNDASDSDDNDSQSDADAPDDAVQQLRQQSWQTGALATAAVKAFADAAGYSIKVDKKSKGGSSKKLVCTTANCPVQVRMRKRADKTWHVSDAVTEHVNCTSQVKMSAARVATVAAVRSAIIAKRDISVKALQALLQVRLLRQLAIRRCSRLLRRR